MMPERTDLWNLWKEVGEHYVLPLTSGHLDYLSKRVEKLKDNVYCVIFYETANGKRRMTKGLFQGVDKGKVILLQNDRKNRVSLDMIVWWTYNIKQQGGEIE
jgi:hypothetical protein